MESEDFSGTIGRAMVVIKSNHTIYNSKFEANHANVGGAVFFGNKSNITINNCEFTFNRATDCPMGELCLSMKKVKQQYFLKQHLWWRWWYGCYLQCFSFCFTDLHLQ